MKVSNLSTSDKTQLIDSFMRLIEQPAEFSAIYTIDTILRQTELSAVACTYLKSEPAVAAIIQESYIGPIPQIEVLLSYPANSLGYQYAAHLQANQFTPVFYPQQTFDDDISYLTLRRSQTHDIYHVITGFGTDLPGEVGLQAFQLAQTRSPLAIPLIATALAATLDQSVLFCQLMTQLQRGWEMGIQAQPFLAQKWEEAWEKPVVDWRQDLGVKVPDVYAVCA